MWSDPSDRHPCSQNIDNLWCNNWNTGRKGIITSKVYYTVNLEYACPWTQLYFVIEIQCWLFPLPGWEIPVGVGDGLGGGWVGLSVGGTVCKNRYLCSQEILCNYTKHHVQVLQPPSLPPSKKYTLPFTSGTIKHWLN